MTEIKSLDSQSLLPIELTDGVFALTAQGCISWLVTGKDRGLVIDTSFGNVDVYENARKATQLPLILVNTHGHSDHIGANDKFEETHAHEREQVRLSRKSRNVNLVKEGFIFDLGGRKLEVMELPGHTPGGLALFDRENGLIFTGDMLSTGVLFLQFEYSDLDAYIASMDRLIAMDDAIKAIFVCHGTENPATIELAEKSRELVKKVQNGELIGEPVHLDTEDGGYDVHKYSYNGVAVYYK